MDDAGTKIVVDRPRVPSGPTGEIAMRRIMVSGSTTSFSAVVASRLVAAGVDGNVSD